MKFLRKQALIARLLALVIALQFLVPVGAAVAQPQDPDTGFVICTSTGLKMLTASGALAPYDGEQGETHKSAHGPCPFCLAGVCAPVANLPNLPLLATMPNSRPPTLQPQRFATTIGSTRSTPHRVRAPPVS